MDQAQQLRNIVKLHNQNNIQNARVITITSGKGGVGKSNMAVNLAVQFRKRGKRVIIFDADFGLANVEVMFGTLPKHNLSDVIYGNMAINEIISEGPEGIGFISGGSGIVGLNDLTHDQLDGLVGKLSQLNLLADILLIDTGAGVSESVMDFVLASPEVLLVSTPEPSSLTDSYSLVKTLYKNPTFHPQQTSIYLVANKVTSEEEASAVYEKLSSVVSRFLNGRLSYLGMVPMDAALEKAVRSQQIISITSPNAHASRAFSALTDTLLNESAAPNTTARWGITQLFNSFLRRG
ncbi:MAG: MinD/ParA family protein [Lachnospiraceae bacterium]|nr:MinD/ParA family protein [Lachnospiraceae bacterium]